MVNFNAEGGFRLTGEPEMPDDATVDDYLIWQGWARERIEAVGRQLGESMGRLNSQSQELADLKKKVDAYEIIVSSRRTWSFYEPGRVVYLVNAGNQAATILAVHIQLAGVVHYKVGWWTRGGPDGWAWHEALLHDSELSPETPLVAPSPVADTGIPF